MIRVLDLQKKFGDLIAVDGLSFEVSRNEIFGLLGPNGAGKTTTINMICGLLSPSGGKILFEEKKALKSLIGYCPQENIYYPKLTCLEQLMFLGQMYGVPSQTLKIKALELLDLLGLDKKKHVWASKLSGGMKRRLNICLALIHDPEILILDEPEAGLDPQSRILVREFFKAFGQKKTIVLTTHNMDEADRLADRVAIVDHGKLLLLDTPQNLKKTIGEGDILEMTFENYDKEKIDQYESKITSLSMNAKSSGNSVLIKHPNVIGQLSMMKELAEKNGLVVSEIKLRQNTLEDVFIHLTGRKLRQ